MRKKLYVNVKLSRDQSWVNLLFTVSQGSLLDSVLNNLILILIRNQELSWESRLAMECQLAFEWYYTTKRFPEDWLQFWLFLLTNFEWTVKILLWNIFTFCYYLLFCWTINLLLVQTLNKPPLSRTNNLISTQVA